MFEALLSRLPSALQQQKIAVIMGGPSPEREVSLRSGQRVHQALQRLGLDSIALEAGPDLAQQLKASDVAFAFLATHGLPGEDGQYQGLLNVLGIPYTGADVIGSGLALNKSASKSLLEKEGVCTPTWQPLNQEEPLEVIAHRLSSTIGFPLILKPVYGGSSLGIRLARDLMELRTSLEQLNQNYDALIAERYIQGRELTLSILEDSEGRPYSLPILELQPRNLFYDYECKVEKGMAEFLVPADLTHELAQKAESLALLAHKKLEQRDFSRSDFILGPDQELYYLETNSIPGLTELSDLPAQASAYGMSFEEVVVSVLMGAYRRSQNS